MAPGITRMLRTRHMGAKILNNFKNIKRETFYL